MFKFIKDEIELITAGKNDVAGLVTLFSVYGIVSYVAYMIYNSFTEFLIPASSYAYSFSRESYCSAPPSELIVLLSMLVCMSIIAIMEHYEILD